MSKKLVEIKNLSKHFKIDRKNVVRAVDNISFHINERETLGIVGESGCGKSTLGRTILGLERASSGQVIYKDLDVHKASKDELREFKKSAQIILQDPYASLNPRMTVKDIIAEGIDAHGLYKGEEKLEKIYKLLETVGLNREHASRFPHEFSGGQRQRIGIARTLAVEPEFIVCDEPISALDVSIQAQIVNLLIDLQKDFGLTYLFIAHDLSMVRHISDRVGVMYLGSLVELAGSEDLYKEASHPYTRALMSAIPSVDLDNPMSERRIKMLGEVPSPINLEEGCKFYSRCRERMDECKKVSPEFKEIREGHYVACHLYK